MLVYTKLRRRIGDLLRTSAQIPAPAVSCDEAGTAARRGQPGLVADPCPVQPSLPPDAIGERYVECTKRSLRGKRKSRIALELVRKR